MSMILKGDNRVGYIAIWAGAFSEDMAAVRQILNRIVVFRAENDLFRNRIEYFCLCDLFRNIALGEKAPNYKISIIRKRSGEWVIQAQESDSDFLETSLTDLIVLKSCTEYMEADFNGCQFAVPDQPGHFVPEVGCRHPKKESYSIDCPLKKDYPARRVKP